MKYLIVFALVIVVFCCIYFYFFSRKESKEKKEEKIEKSTAKKLYKEFHKKFKNDLSKEEFMDRTGDDGLLYIALKQLYDIATLDDLDVDGEITEKIYEKVVSGIDLQ